MTHYNPYNHDGRLVIHFMDDEVLTIPLTDFKGHNAGDHPEMPSTAHFLQIEYNDRRVVYPWAHIRSVEIFKNTKKVV